MIIRNTKEFLKKTFQKKIICLDIGKVKVGIAISDSNKKISTPLKIIIRDKRFYSNLKDLILEYDIFGILIGLPSLSFSTFPVSLFPSRFKRPASLKSNAIAFARLVDVVLRFTLYAIKKSLAAIAVAPDFLICSLNSEGP